MWLVKFQVGLLGPKAIPDDRKHTTFFTSLAARIFSYFNIIPFLFSF